jgi:hypothetical protein
MKPSQVYEFMKQFYGGAENISFLRTDCNNEIGREWNKYLESNDEQTLLEYSKNKQIEDPAFFYHTQPEAPIEQHPRAVGRPCINEIMGRTWIKEWSEGNVAYSNKDVHSVSDAWLNAGQSHQRDGRFHRVFIYELDAKQAFARLTVARHELLITLESKTLAVTVGDLRWSELLDDRLVDRAGWWSGTRRTSRR